MEETMAARELLGLLGPQGRLSPLTTTCPLAKHRQE